MTYMIEVHNVQHEIYMYIEELKLYGDIVHHSELFPTYIWLESDWEHDILKELYGVKSVREPKYRQLNGGE